MVDRASLKRLVRRRLADAKILFDNRRYDSAYYVAGYAIECAIKACIAKQFRRNTIPDRRLVNDSYSHDFQKLLQTAGIFDDLQKDRKGNPSLDSSWNVAKDWKSEVRYSTSVKKSDARDLIDAIEDEQHGLLQWLARHW